MSVRAVVTEVAPQEAARESDTDDLVDGLVVDGYARVLGLARELRTVVSAVVVESAVVVVSAVVVESCAGWMRRVIGGLRSDHEDALFYCGVAPRGAIGASRRWRGRRPRHVDA